VVGDGHAGPVVAGNRVFVLGREGNEEIVRCLELAAGQELWSGRYPAPYELHSAARSHGKGPKSTPAVAADRLVTLGISGILSCWEPSSGNLLWRRQFDKQFASTSPLYGTATSPMIVDDYCVAHVGGHDGGALGAFALADGKLIWQWPQDGPGYASPILFELNGARHVVTQSQQFVLAVVAQSGTLAWKVPYDTAYVQNIITPLGCGETVVYSGIGKGTTAIRAKSTNGRQPPETIWHNPAVSMYMSSPVLIGRHVYAFAHKDRGQLVCLEAATGKERWQSEGRLGENAALVHAGSALLVQTTNADLIVLDANPDRYRELARYQLSDTATWAHPAVLDDRVLVKDATSLTLWSVAR
jgi:outer membrane protein assembly factor BamB